MIVFDWNVKTEQDELGVGTVFVFLFKQINHKLQPEVNCNHHRLHDAYLTICKQTQRKP